MRKFVLFSLTYQAQDFSYIDLTKLMNLEGDIEITRYIKERIHEASLRKLGEYGYLYQLELYCKFYGRRPTGKLPVKPPILEQKSDIWVRKGTRLAMAIDLPLNLSPIAATLLSAGLYNKLGEAAVLEFNTDLFKRLLDKVKKRGGRLTSIHLLNVHEPYLARVLQISEWKGAGLGSFPGLDEAMRSSKIKRLGFHLDFEEDKFSFWVANFGNGTLYAPSILEPHHINKLLRFFEEILEN